MRESGGRLAAGIGALALLWIVVYWWWPTRPPLLVSSATDVSVEADLTPVVTDAQPPSRPVAAPVATSPSLQADTSAPAALGAEAEPQGPPEPQVRVIPPEFFSHVVKQGETLRSISRRYLGTEAHADAISRANPLASLNPLKVGRTIRVPKDPNNVQGIPVEPLPTGAGVEREYVVRPGDSLSAIAGEMYGDPGLSSVIFEANKATMPDENTLKVGQRLRIPPAPR